MVQMGLWLSLHRQLEIAVHRGLRRAWDKSIMTGIWLLLSRISKFLSHYYLLLLLLLVATASPDQLHQVIVHCTAGIHTWRTSDTVCIMAKTLDYWEPGRRLSPITSHKLQWLI